ncbi:MAG: hypothetical protein KME25_33205 [Symplocastrum torsivum CPER-KK1]|jgi:hypothetical protein|uniref:Integrase n=1 Tax=Symplocastrum torsivum CPER-KK1 TaxID=450513 RepID=A0A951PSY9_9CYAN|nr:hypothetical protein [Symplocastrum torsivum CPER-KK1]
MDQPKHFFDVYCLYEKHIEATHDSKRAKNILSETRCAIMRPLLLGWGYQGKIGGSKIMPAEVQAAKEFMKTQKLEKLLDARKAQQRGFELLKRSQKSQGVYGARLNQLLIWCEQQAWWTFKRLHPAVITPDQCCPTLGKTKAFEKRSLTNRRGRYSSYTLQPQETNSNLEAELKQFYQFLTEPEWPGRVTEKISHSCADGYLSEIRLILGWFYRYQPVPQEQLSLGLLIPKLTNKELANRSDKEKKGLWKPHQLKLETWLCKHLKFLREVRGSQSPRTKLSRLTALSALGKFVYHTEVEEVSDYADIPVLKEIGKYTYKAREEVASWQRQKRYVANQTEKWPDAVEGKTVLTTVREQILEPLRQECRCRYGNGKPRGDSALATSFQRYLAWSLLADMPARRQEEYRSLKISLSCPIERPKEVPLNGLYHPLPPERKRERLYDGTLDDNYLYKTYVHKGKSYKNGVWILDIQDYKTLEIHSPQSIVVPNRQFADGTCLYDYIERYLYGWWTPGGRKNQFFYDWWQPELLGCRGRWITLGRAEFNPRDVCCLQDKTESDFWSWGYLFVQPKVGLPLNGSKFGALVEVPAHRLSGKYISPHTMRSIWATWAFQVGLSDQQKESLAYAMGHTLRTLKKMYERCTPNEKRRPIEEAIDELLFETLQSNLTADSVELARRLQKLTSTQRQRLVEMLPL